jgi:hypothetical protein
MDDLEKQLATIVGEHGMVKVIRALTTICFAIATKEIAVREKDDHFPYHGWRHLGLRLRKAADHASDLRMK